MKAAHGRAQVGRWSAKFFVIEDFLAGRYWQVARIDPALVPVWVRVKAAAARRAERKLTAGLSVAALLHGCKARLDEAIGGRSVSSLSDPQRSGATADGVGAFG